jgi:hypothetical protein
MSHCIQTEDRAPLGNALLDHIQKARIADLVAHVLHAPLGGPLATDAGCLLGLLRTFPGSPGFTFDAVELLKFQVGGVVEVANHRVSPDFADRFQVDADRRLFDPDLFGDGHLGPALDVQIGHLLPPSQYRLSLPS